MIIIIMLSLIDSMKIGEITEVSRRHNCFNVPSDVKMYLLDGRTTKALTSMCMHEHSPEPFLFALNDSLKLDVCAGALKYIKLRDSMARFRDEELNYCSTVCSVK